MKNKEKTMMERAHMIWKNFMTIDDVVSFAKEERKALVEELSEEIEGMKRSVHKSADNPPYPSGWNDALFSIKEKLTSKE